MYQVPVPTDFDGDGYLGEADLQQTLRHLTHDLLTPDEYTTIVAKVGGPPPGVKLCRVSCVKMGLERET